MQEYKYYKFYMHSQVGTRAAGHYAPGIGYTVRYRLTPKGRGILIDMMERRVMQKADKLAAGQALNTVGSVAEYDAKKDDMEVLPGPAERKDETWQKLDAIINDLKNLRDSLS